MRALFLAAALIATAHAEAPLSAEAAWRAEIADANEAYARKPTAILKIDDAIYLEPGQTAELEDSADGGHTWHLTKDASAKKDGPPRVVFAADGKSARLERGAPPPVELLGAKDPVELGGGLRISGGMAQLEPGRDGFRLMIFNDANPAAASFTGLDYYPYDPSFVVTATFMPADLKPKVFQTSRGWYKQFYHAGDAVFTLKGSRCGCRCMPVPTSWATSTASPPS